MRINREVKFFLILALFPACLLFLLYYVVPIISLIVTSLFQWEGINMGGYHGLANYKALAVDNVFYTALGNNLTWTLASVCVHIPLALLIALLLARKFRGWKILRTVYFLPHVIAITAYAVIYMNIFNPSFGALNAVLKVIGLGGWAKNWLFDPHLAWPVILSTWVFHIGLFAMVILSDIISIPEDMFEAAEIDGASKFKQSIYLTIPLLRTTIGTCLILDVTGGLRYFEGLYIMTNGAPNYRTETLALYLYQQLMLVRNSYANTIGVALMALGMIFVLMINGAFKLGKTDY